MTTRTLEEWVDTQFAADYFKKSLSTIHRWCRKGEIPATKVGRDWYIRSADLNKRMEPTDPSPATGGEPAKTLGPPKAAFPGGGDS